MANEAVLEIETELPISMTCADGTGIEKGAFLKLADPYTVSIATALNDIVGGIAAEEKIASDGKTKIAVYRGGIFKVVTSGSVTVGNACVMAGRGSTNEIEAASINHENIMGIALETATDTESLLFELKPVVMNLA